MTASGGSEMRRHIADALQTAIPADRSRLLAFLEGDGDCMLDTFEMDSLGFMEFCIALELSTGIALTPEDVQSAGSLAAVASLAAEWKNRDAGKILGECDKPTLWHGSE